MYSISDVDNAKKRLHDLLDEKTYLIEKSEPIPQKLWDDIYEAYDRSVFIQQRYCPKPGEFSLYRLQPK